MKHEYTDTMAKVFEAICDCNNWDEMGQWDEYDWMDAASMAIESMRAQGIEVVDWHAVDYLRHEIGWVVDDVLYLDGMDDVWGHAIKDYAQYNK